MARLPEWFFFMIPIACLGLLATLIPHWQQCPALEPSAHTYIILANIAGLLGSTAMFYFRTLTRCPT